jgi:D-serine deaminase-like pyridoxal phosphate-dependent protein
MDIHSLDTPFLAVDLDIFERNLQVMADYCRQHQLRLRPHAKTHKSPWVASQQLRRGAAGITVAKPGEAEVMSVLQPAELLVAYPTIGEGKLRRLARIVQASEGRTRITISIDSNFAAQAIAMAAQAANVRFGILVELDAGLHRVGLTTTEELLALVRIVHALPGLEFDGLAFYPGHIKNNAGIEAAHADIARLLERNLQAVRKAGFAVPIVSGGSTPSWKWAHLIPELNEVRPGTYVYNDRNTIMGGACRMEDCAAVVVATVVSTAVPGQIIIDGGSKTFSSDRLNGAPDAGFGLLLEDHAALFHKMNEEHGYIDVSQCQRSFKVGDRVRILMNHVCVAMNLQERAYGFRQGQLEREWEIAARGKLQ